MKNDDEESPKRKRTHESIEKGDSAWKWATTNIGTRLNADDNQSSVIIDRLYGRWRQVILSSFSCSSLLFSSLLFTQTTIIEIFLSRNTHVSKMQHKQNIKFSAFIVCNYMLLSCSFHFPFIIIMRILIIIIISFDL